jgi:hypothetical protein
MEILMFFSFLILNMDLILAILKHDIQNNPKPLPLRKTLPIYKL